VQVDPAVQGVWRSVKSPGGLLLLRKWLFPVSAYHRGLLGRGPQ
jgi:hypothetical protein